MPRLQEGECLLDLTVFKQWEFVTATRKYLTELILGVYKDRKSDHLYAEKLATASSEILENAFKYSPAQSDLHIRLLRSDSAITLEVRNWVEAGTSVLSVIRQEIGCVYGEADPREAFKKKVLTSLTDQSGKSMLGYAKIRLETGAEIRAELEGENLLAITVVFPLEPAPIR